MMNDVLNCQNLSFKYSHQTLFSKLTFRLNLAQSICIIGQNGSGKTTLLKLLAGLLRPASGKLFCFSEEIWPQKNCRFEHKSVYLSYKPSFYEDLTVKKNICVYLACYQESAQIQEIESVLKRFDLFNKYNSRVDELSSGQKRRLTLAIMLLLKPRLVLIDEPTNGLDTVGAELCFKILSELKIKHQTSFVIASHDKKVIEWCNQTIDLNYSMNSIT